MNSIENLTVVSVPIPTCRLVEAVDRAEIAYWCKTIEWRYPETSHSGCLRSKYRWKTVDGNEFDTDPDTFFAALPVLAVQRPRLFCDLMRGENLPAVGDALIQIAVLGGITYS